MFLRLTRLTLSLQARPEAVQGANLSIMVSFMPISEEEKFDLYTNFMKCTTATMKDLPTYVLMILLVAFDGASEGSVASRLRTNFQAMLARHLTRRREAGGEAELDRVYECIALLPQLAKPFTGIKYYLEIPPESQTETVTQTVA
jgi:hypothetical protein